MEAPSQFSKKPWRSWVELGNEERKEIKIEKKHAKMVMTRWENLTAKLLLQLQEMEDEEERREKVVAKHAEARRRKAERIQREAEEMKAKAEEKKKKTKEKKAALSDKAIDITRELKKAAAEKWEVELHDQANIEMFRELKRAHIKAQIEKARCLEGGWTQAQWNDMVRAEVKHLMKDSVDNVEETRFKLRLKKKAWSLSHSPLTSVCAPPVCRSNRLRGSCSRMPPRKRMLVIFAQTEFVLCSRSIWKPMCALNHF